MNRTTRTIATAAALAVATLTVAVPAAQAAPHRGIRDAISAHKTHAAQIANVRAHTARRVTVGTSATTVSCPISGIPVEGCTPRGGVWPPPPR